MKLRDTDYLFATMHIRANEKKLLTPQSIERMIEAKTSDEISKILSDFGYGTSAMKSFDDVERVIEGALSDTLTTVSEACGNDAIKEVFLLKYDFHNIKSLIKANFTGADADHLFSEVSMIPADELKKALKTEDFSRLPEKMANALVSARDILSRTQNPEMSDFLLDEACFDMMTDAAERSGSGFLKGYVRLLADTANLRLAVRLIRRGKADETGDRLLTFGSISKEKFLDKNFSENLSSTALSKAGVLAETVAEGKADFISFEKELDVALSEYMKEAKYVPFDERPIVAYLAAREADATTVRIIMSGKFMDFSPDEIRSRLRVG